MNDLQVAELIGRVQHLTVAVEKLLEQTVTPGRVWLTPGEMAQLAGCTGRAINKWRGQGIFRETSLRPSGTTWQYHRVEALADIENRTLKK